MFQALDVIGVLSAQHLVDLFDEDCACECPRCCLACRAVKEVMETIDMRNRFYRLGVEGHIWQNTHGGFDPVMIKTKWHDPCPVYEGLEG